MSFLVTVLASFSSKTLRLGRLTTQPTLNILWPAGKSLLLTRRQSHGHRSSASYTLGMRSVGLTQLRFTWSTLRSLLKSSSLTVRLNGTTCTMSSGLKCSTLRLKVSSSTTLRKTFGAKHISGPHGQSSQQSGREIPICSQLNSPRQRMVATHSCSASTGQSWGPPASNPCQISFTWFTRWSASATTNKPRNSSTATLPWTKQCWRLGRLS